MSSRYTVTEPHPTVLKDSYAHAGRGGAGNLFRAPATTPSSGVPTISQPLPPSTGRFYSGRGGAGNAHPSAARPTMSFEEQYKLQSHIEETPLGHVGRGGAGNVYLSGPDSRVRKPSDASSHRSNSESGSLRSGFFGRLSGVSLSGRH